MDRPISSKTHAILGYATGIVLFFAPNIFGFADNGGAAVAIPRIIAVILLLSELFSNNGLSIAGIIPMRLHLMMDMVAGLFLAASPWLFGFHNQGANAWLPHLIIGLMYGAVAVMTQAEPAREPTRRAHA
jgi:hypothetical protein